MALLERVATLLRANVNDLISRAEDPEKMLKQLLLDMENQLLQVKTQVAITIADLHMLEKKTREHEEVSQSWQQKAALAVAKGEDDLARAALDRSLSHRQMAESFRQQVEDQRTEADILRSHYAKLQQKLRETEARCELLIAQSRRSRAQAKAAKAGPTPAPANVNRAIDRLRQEIASDQTTTLASQTLLEADLADNLDERFRRLERQDAIEALLNDLKQLPEKAS
jgi:phage shock protein A